MQSPVTASPPQPDAPAQSGEQGYPDDDPSALTAFRDTLDPYGAWVDDPTYGLVWLPNSNAVGPDFQPYVSAGHWTYDTGWIWVSDYPWGWAPFHYGRWVQTPGEGWAWVPGRTYSGAWVDWRVGHGYVGWAPAGPDWAWRNGAAVNLGRQITTAYCFAPQATIFAPTLSRNVVRGPSWMSRTVPYAQVAPAGNRANHDGPAPAALGIPLNHVERPPERDAGLRRAVQFSRPATTPRINSETPHPGVTAPQPKPAPRATTAPAPHVTSTPRPIPSVPRQTPAQQTHPGVTQPQPQQPAPRATTAPHTTEPPATHPSTSLPPAPGRPTAVPQTPNHMPREQPAHEQAPPAHTAPKANPQH